MTKPLKRYKALIPISREHHDGLMVSIKIKEGFKMNIAVEKIKEYTDWFWETQLKDHFEFEEKYIFPIMDKENELIKRVLKEHIRLKGLFTSKENIEQNLTTIEKELVEHIRFEERILFQEIQTIATAEELEIIEKSHPVKLVKECRVDF